MKKIIQLELNEISQEVIEKAVLKNNLPNLKRLVTDFKRISTKTETKYEKIEPWIVWVNAHTGKSFSEHQVFRLSDAEKLKYPQTWDYLSEKNLNSLVFGCMNGKLNKNFKGIFVPDPWAKNGKTFPEDFQSFYDFVSSKVQTHATKEKNNLGFDNLKLIKLFLTLRLNLIFLIQLGFGFLNAKLKSKSSWKLASLFDLLQAKIFVKLFKKHDFDYSILFLNSIAHYQHHFWRNHWPEKFNTKIKCPDANEDDDPILYGLKNFDLILKDIFKLVDENKNVSLLVASGFEQVPYVAAEQEGGMNYYRLNDHKAFVSRLLSLDGIEVFPLMSRDWQVKGDKEKVLELKTILENLIVKGDKVFKVELREDNSLFIETSVTKGFLENEEISLSGTQQTFGLFTEQFEHIAVKSGHHVSKGNLWTNTDEFIPSSGELDVREIHSKVLSSL